MPIYEYTCDACSQSLELMQKITDAAPESCPHCGKKTLRRIFQSLSLQFQGSGFYINDYSKEASAAQGPKHGCKSGCGCKIKA